MVYKRTYYIGRFPEKLDVHGKHAGCPGDRLQFLSKPKVILDTSPKDFSVVHIAWTNGNIVDCRETVDFQFFFK